MKLSKTLSALIFLSNLTTELASGESIRAGASIIQEEHQLDTTEPFVQFLKAKEENGTMMNTLMGLRGEFKNWVKKFEREYKSLEEEFERMIVWVENHKYITMHNSQEPKASYTVAHNDFSDMTNDEFQKRFFLGKYSPGKDVIRASQEKAKKDATAHIHEISQEVESYKAEFRYLRQLAIEQETGFRGFFDDGWFDDSTDDGSADTDDGSADADDGSATTDDSTDGLPDSVDWVEKGAVTPVKNQGSCGSCWAFSATGAIEGAEFVAHGELVSLSEQNLLDCDKYDNGCSGGLMDPAFKYDESANGLCSEEDYPYLATDGNDCNTTCTKVTGSHVISYNDIAEKDKAGLLASLVIQPTSVAMEAGQLSFQFYNSGVFSDESCGKDGSIDHGVLAVGYGTDEDGKKFWKIKNSWGDAWGEDGYFRLDRDSKNAWGTCAVLMVMTAPTVE